MAERIFQTDQETIENLIAFFREMNRDAPLRFSFQGDSHHIISRIKYLSDERFSSDALELSVTCFSNADREGIEVIMQRIREIKEALIKKHNIPVDEPFIDCTSDL